MFGLHGTELGCLLSNESSDVFRIQAWKVEMVPRESPRQKTINERKHNTSRSLGKAALVAQVAPIFFEQRLPWRWNCFDGALGRDAFLA